MTGRRNRTVQCLALLLRPWILSNLKNEMSEIIIIAKSKLNQTLLLATLDRVLEGLVERNEPPALVARRAGVDEALVAGIARQIDRAEYKRQQAAPGLRVSTKAFGSGRRIPIAQVSKT